MSIVSFPLADSPAITPVGFDPTRASSFPLLYCAACFVASSSPVEVCLRTPSTAPGRRTRTAHPSQVLRRLAASALPQRLDRLLQTTLRRTRVRPAVSRPLYPPRRHLQPSLARIGGRPSYLSLARFCRPQSAESDDLSRDEFLRRFLLHILPKGFVRIRHFGFLANHRRATLLPLCCTALNPVLPPQEPETSMPQESPPLWRCPKCGGPMVVIERLTAAQVQLRSPPLLATTA